MRTTRLTGRSRTLSTLGAACAALALIATAACSELPLTAPAGNGAYVLPPLIVTIPRGDVSLDAPAAAPTSAAEPGA